MKLSNAEGRALLNKQKTPIAKWGKTGKPKQSESQQQSECVDWFRAQYPQYSLLMYAVPNGGKRSGREAAQFVREGVLSGVPDLVLAVPKSGFHGLYIEQKVKGNTTSPNQKAVMAALTAQGYKCEVVYSVEEFKQVIQQYLAGSNFTEVTPEELQKRRSGAYEYVKID